MRLPRFVFAVAFLPSFFAATRGAEACGGAFFETSMPEVSGHRMIFSVSQGQTTLWDEISYSGNPSDFSWVLPIQGQVTVALSSDAIFSLLDQDTQVIVQSPNLPECEESASFASSSTSSGAGGGSVTILAQQTVGPYDTVQLSSSDPNALTSWLDMNGYVIPADVQPVIDAYVNEGFDFLALKLQPGMSVTAMQPVSVTTPGASATLPLRMVAAGIGSVVPITLFVVAEGRYEPKSPWFTIDDSALVWDWSTMTSNYDALVEQTFSSSNGEAWQIEDALPLSSVAFDSDLIGFVDMSPATSGYGDGTQSGAEMAAEADVNTLFAGIDPGSTMVTRMRGELTVDALASDLEIVASQDQTPISNTYVATKSINAPGCGGFGDESASATTSGAGGAGGTMTTTTAATNGAGGATNGAGGAAPVSSSAGSANDTSSDSSCAADVSSRSTGGAALVLFSLALAASFARKRASRRGLV